MKIIFLDVDGVLNSIYTKAYYQTVLNKNNHSEAIIDGTSIMALNNIIQNNENKIKFVLSSTWRFNYSKEEIENLLSSHGFKGVFHEDWATQKMFKRRGFEVQEWLSRHNEVKTWICLDDSQDFLPESNLILVQGYTGITVYEVVLAKYLLGLLDNSDENSHSRQSKEMHQAILNNVELSDTKKYYLNFKEHYNQRYFDAQELVL